VSSRLDPDALPSAQVVAERIFRTLERFLHIEAASGAVLIAAAVIALVWANSPFGEGYEHFWHAPVSFAFAGYSVSQPLHFLINDVLMTVFFLVVGMEVRREIHEGALASARVAALPVMAAIGGVAVPAAIYLALTGEPGSREGWAVPVATDIAFALGVLALLGKSIPSGVRVLLLSIAIIDDIVAVIIIASFYSNGIDAAGFVITSFGALLVIGFQRIGIASAFAYVLPGAVVWLGMLHAGAHPTLAGVLLGLMTPVRSRPARLRPLAAAARALQDLDSHQGLDKDPHALRGPLAQLRNAERELLPPVVRVQMALHPWVAFGVMPLFALANAGVNLDPRGLAAAGSAEIAIAVAAALVLGKPAGILLASFIAVRLNICRLPPGASWTGVLLVGCLAGIGFTMAIFIATLAFADAALLSAAKIGVLTASAIAGAAGLVVGRLYAARRSAR
jgi:NhaA family Na+:H+ antiporter